jgi:hypothetical protein
LPPEHIEVTSNMVTPSSARDQPLYQRTLGDAWHRLSPQIRQLHSIDGESTFVGECSVERGGHPLAWLIAGSIGLPAAGANQEIHVTLIQRGDQERWIRQVGKRRFSSTQGPAPAEHESLIRERFGPIAVCMALDVDDGCLHYLVRRWTLFGIPLPKAIGPRARAVESVDQGRFHFDVEIRHALCGLIVRYHGTLSPATAAARAE